MCFSRADASTDMQCSKMTYLARYVTSRDLNLRSTLEIDLLMSICSYFDASLRQEHYADKIMSLALLVQKLFAKKNIFAKKALFSTFLTSVV